MSQGFPSAFAGERIEALTRFAAREQQLFAARGVENDRRRIVRQLGAFLLPDELAGRGSRPASTPVPCCPPMITSDLYTVGEDAKPLMQDVIGDLRLPKDLPQDSVHWRVGAIVQEGAKDAFAIAGDRG